MPAMTTGFLASDSIITAIFATSGESLNQTCDLVDDGSAVRELLGKFNEANAAAGFIADDALELFSSGSMGSDPCVDGLECASLI